MATKLANPDAAGATSQPCISPAEAGLGRNFAHSTRAIDATNKETAENGAPAATGPRRAVKDNILSATATGAPAAQSGNKVERDIRGRRSTGLTAKAIGNIISGAQFAAESGVPLNRHLTIHFVAASIADPVRAIGRYLNLALDWLATQGAPFAYIWVREAGERKGEHVHILMHVPPHLIGQFARRERGWRKRIGAARALGAFHTTPVGRSYRHAQARMQFGERYSDHLAEIVGYLVKGAEPRAVRALGLTRVETGGELWGKRTGMSENIGRAARPPIFNGANGRRREMRTERRREAGYFWDRMAAAL